MYTSTQVGWRPAIQDMRGQYFQVKKGNKLQPVAAPNTTNLRSIINWFKPKDNDNAHQ